MVNTLMFVLFLFASVLSSLNGESEIQVMGLFIIANIYAAFVLSYIDRKKESKR